MARFTCPACKATLSAADGAEGQAVTCGCGWSAKIPVARYAAPLERYEVDRSALASVLVAIAGIALQLSGLLLMPFGILCSVVSLVFFAFSKKHEGVAIAGLMIGAFGVLLACSSFR